MEELIEKLKQHSWESTASTLDGSSIFVVEYGDDKSLRFWNVTSNSDIDCDAVCDEIADKLSDDGLNFDYNTVREGWNVVTFEIFDNDLF